MKHLDNYLSFTSSNSFSETVKLVRDDEYFVDYTFQDDKQNKFLVQFKNLKKSKNILGKEYTMSYFVWDNDINNWSVKKLVESSPYRIVSTVLGTILNDFVQRKYYLCYRVQFEGLAKENEKDFQTQRTKMYLRYLQNNPVPDFKLINYGNNIITLNRINK